MSAFESALPAFNASVLGAFANCIVAWSGGSAPGLFARGTTDSFGMLNHENTVTCVDADVAAVTTGLAITINSVAHTVRALRPDGNGMTEIVVEKS
jgi:hypothetical protein